MTKNSVYNFPCAILLEVKDFLNIDTWKKIKDDVFNYDNIYIDL